MQRLRARRRKGDAVTRAEKIEYHLRWLIEEASYVHDGCDPTYITDLHQACAVARGVLGMPEEGPTLADLCRVSGEARADTIAQSIMKGLRRCNEEGRLTSGVDCFHAAASPEVKPRCDH